MRKVKLIDQQTDQSGSSTGEDVENAVQHVNGERTPSFVLKGKIDNRQFSTMIDSGSPITISTAGDLRKILKQDVIFARPLPKNKEYVHYNGGPLNLLGFTTADVKVGEQTLKQARIVIAREGRTSLIEKDWLAKLNFKVAESNSEYINNIINKINSKTNKTEYLAELKRKEHKITNIFKRQGKIVGHTNKIEFKERSKGNPAEGKKSTPVTTKGSGRRNQKPLSSRPH